MRNHWPLFNIVNTLWLCFCILLFSKVVLVLAGIQMIGNISPGFYGSQMNWIDKNGMFLVSNKQEFGFGFVKTSNDSTLFLLAIVHTDSSKIVWTANRESPVSNSDKFVFDEKGNVFLQKGRVLIWQTNTSDMKVSSMELQDNGNLVLLRNDSKVIWQSFDYPTDTLLPMQNFTKGMKLISEPDSNNLTYVLEIDSQTGNVILSTGLPSPQPYWSMQKDNRKIVNENGDEVASATLDENSWKFYDKEKSLLSQFIISDAENSIWIAVLGNDGFITFYNLQNRGSIGSSKTTIPKDSCSTPQPCGPYNICNGEKKCSCPSFLSSRRSCEPGFVSPCNSKSSIELMKGDDGLDYFALGFLQPSSKTDLIGCKNSCSVNCSCLAMFFQKSSGNCYLLDRIGSFEKTDNDSGFVSYIKVSRDGSTDTDTGENGNKNKQIIVVVIIVIVTLFIIAGMIYVGLKNLKKKENLSESPEEISDDDANFLEGLTSMPIRFSYNDLGTATNNFSEKLGQGGFGSVYKGVLQDGTQIAVKQLEGIGQGKKEFRVEVSIIGSIHHHHLVRLKGFCAEGSHKLLVYEYMENGSLDKWIFKKNNEELSLDWNTRYNIALGTAKGLAYLHEDCDSKIVHCDIKPENVLLDNNFEAKVSDFGLAKLMNREQSHVFTTMRGTRGYLAPEWITNYAISEKSDVYSYGMVLLEIIGGRKNYDPKENSEKSHFPSFAYKMMEQGKMENVIDSKVKMIENDVRVEIALNVAFWCIQEDMCLRPSMNKVVQMLEGLCDVPKLPNVSPLGSHFYSNFLRPTSESGTSSEPTDGNSDAYLSAVRLSGPR
ncbi:G-type lectin S-receptor-like serine/threonine-protein kinase SD2-5 isoform X1 [Trifolium pratense]|uniref:G-type lectin S-receptor-like serine/threonine-protein kinase SD2-5 isoform X1 n=1 Tax=Trifolium pratense TaxID=57577 RepID=UPI001E698207|nr:G-type lectin S-receptor-like serine/threonine-protein kinase SD2-5 isoform X1 [Trifolium pratense]